MLLEVDVCKMLVSGDQWAEWRGYQLPICEDYVCIWTPAGTKKHWKPNFWKPDFFHAERHSLSYFWPGAWYTIHISYDKNGNFHDGYCDIVLPTPDYTCESRELVYTDLYIDVVIRKDGSVFTKDHEVFERAARRYPAVEESRKKSFETLYWLEEHAKQWTGPFAIMPHDLPRTDFESLPPEEIRAVIQAAQQANTQPGS